MSAVVQSVPVDPTADLGEYVVLPGMSQWVAMRVAARVRVSVGWWCTTWVCPTGLNAVLGRVRLVWLCLHGNRGDSSDPHDSQGEVDPWGSLC